MTSGAMLFYAPGAGALAMVFWIALLFVIYRITWARGIRQFSAYGA